MKSYLKWAGGKTWLIPHLRPLWAQHQQRELRYVAAGFIVQIHSAPRRISCTGNRTPELEMLAWRNI